MYYNGMYHLFYQYNPHGALWGVGNLSWGHSVSGDLVNWAALDTALDPTSPFDANGCWSGSATILPGGTPAILYTGIDANGEQVQNVAFPRDPADPLLRRWDKPGYNPVIPLPADVPGDKFRDPSTAWLGRDGLWRVAVSAEVRGVASTLVYRSADFLRWERAPAAAPLHASRAAGMVECPDLFPVKEEGDDGDGQGLDASASGAGLRHVLKLSVMDTLQDYYMVGRYDDAADAFVPAEPERGDDVRGWRRLDYGHVYASKTFFDARGSRRVLWAWANESDSQADDVAKGWSGVQVPAGAHDFFLALLGGPTHSFLTGLCDADVPAEAVAGRGREAAAAVAGGGDRNAAEEARRPAPRHGAGHRRHERDRRRRGLAGGRGGRVQGLEPSGGRGTGPQLAAGPAEAVRGEGRLGARRRRAVRAHRDGLQRPARAHRCLLPRVQVPWQVQASHVH
jgi:hypothetical protein